MQMEQGIQRSLHELSAYFTKRYKKFTLYLWHSMALIFPLPHEDDRFELSVADISISNIRGWSQDELQAWEPIKNRDTFCATPNARNKWIQLLACTAHILPIEEKEVLKQFCCLHTRQMDSWRLKRCTRQWEWQDHSNPLNICLTTARRLYPHCHQKASHINRCSRLIDW